MWWVLAILRLVGSEEGTLKNWDNLNGCRPRKILVPELARGDPEPGGIVKTKGQRLLGSLNKAIGMTRRRAETYE